MLQLYIRAKVSSKSPIERALKWVYFRVSEKPLGLVLQHKSLSDCLQFVIVHIRSEANLYNAFSLYGSFFKRVLEKVHLTSGSLQGLENINEAAGEPRKSMVGIVCDIVV